jgi:hypothetical protein
VNRKSLLSAVLTTILVGGLLLVGAMHFSTVQAATEVTGIISSDITWTKANSPYSLTGPTAVGKGVTLTIEAGATVNLNGYYVQVNGTLVAQGSSADKIYFNNGELVFTSVSNGWNEQTSSGNIIENAILDETSISSSQSLKISSSSVNEDYSDSVTISLGSSSIITNNIIKGAIQVDGASALISGNTITGRVYTGDSSTISNNIITQGAIKFQTTNKVYAIQTGMSSTISSNTVTGIANPAYPVLTGELAAISVGGGSSVISNKVTGTITGRPSEISNNVVTGGGLNHDMGGRETIAIYTIYIYSSSSTITDNIITGTNGVAVNFQAGASMISGNTINGNILGGTEAAQSTISRNTITGAIGIAAGSAAIFGNIIEGPINCGGSDASIHDNVISDGITGINVITGTATIERNSITKYSNGISVGSQAIIRSNTISGNNIGIELNNSPSVTIANNNIQNNNQNSIYLKETSNDIEATNNCWGTTDTQAINQTIHDFKNDFNLGKVNFVPFLTEPNPEATPDPNALPISTPTPVPSTSPTPTSSPAQTSTPTPTPSQEHTLTSEQLETIIGAAVIVTVFAAGAGLLIYLIKRK